MNGVLTDLKRAGCTISGAKLQFYIPEIRIVGFIYDVLGRYFNIFKVIKIVEWPSPNNISEIRAFIGIVIYYKIFVKNFAFIITLIYVLMRKRIDFFRE